MAAPVIRPDDLAAARWKLSSVVIMTNRYLDDVRAAARLDTGDVEARLERIVGFLDAAHSAMSAIIDGDPLA